MYLTNLSLPIHIQVQENENEQTMEFIESNAKAVWYKIIHEIDLLRYKHNLVKMFSVFITGEDLFGLTVKKKQNCHLNSFLFFVLLIKCYFKCLRNLNYK